MHLRIGTRRSRLALAQAEEVAGLLRAVGHTTELVPMVTAGDRGASPSAGTAGVKGLFVAEITEAVARGEVDLAVHSAKDLPSEDPEDISVAAVPERRLPYDLLVTAGGQEPKVVGTSSLRRRAQLVRSRPGIRVEDLRGNVDTRLRRLGEGKVDGVVLAAAGLDRLGITPPGALPLPVEEMVPAPGQGALAVHAREGSDAEEAAAELDHERSRTSFEAERRLVSLLGGGCRLPLGAYAEARDEQVSLLAVVLPVDGSNLVRAKVEASGPQAAADEAAEILRSGGAEEILAGARG